jgi:hypothetical protein
MRAKLRGGEMTAQDKSKGGYATHAGTLTTDGKSSPYKDSLDAAGVSYKKAAQWQQLAAFPHLPS